MKQRVALISILLGSSVLLSNQMRGQTPGGEIINYVVYMTNTSEKHYILLNTGELYKRETSPGSYPWGGPSAIHLGNYWGNVIPPAEIIDYKVSGDNNYVCHYVLLRNGDVYMRRYLQGDLDDFRGDPFYMGNFWGDLISTKENSWGSIKENN